MSFNQGNGVLFAVLNNTQNGFKLVYLDSGGFHSRLIIKTLKAATHAFEGEILSSAVCYLPWK